MLKKLSKWVFLDLLGWQIIGPVPKIKKYLIVVAPHTSNWDFSIGVLTRKITPHFNPMYLGKKELFVFPIGYFFKWLGGYPIERSKNTNFVDAVVNVYKSKEEFVTSITPEGTRSYNSKWKTGFYYIAKKADIPILRIGIDFSTKQVVLDNLYKIEKPVDKTVDEFKEYFSQFKGKKPENGVRWPE